MYIYIDVIYNLLVGPHVCAFSFSVVSDSLQPYGLQPARLLYPWGFSRQEYWSGLPLASPRDLYNPGIKPRSSTFQADSLPTEPPGIGNLLFVWIHFRFLRRSIYILCVSQKGQQWGKSNLVLHYSPLYLVFDYQCWKKCMDYSYTTFQLSRLSSSFIL